MKPTWPTYLLHALVCVVGMSAATTRLVQIQVMTRHGARTTLPKTPKLIEGGSALTPLGERQHFNLGAWIRTRYEADGVDPLSIKTLDYSRMFLTSSEFDRTMVSANSLLLGLFPEASRSNSLTGGSYLPEGVARANVPLHVNENKHDITIRAYDKCPALVESLDAYYKTQEFAAYEATHLRSGLLYKLAEATKLAKFATKKDPAGRPYIPLEDVWNAFDEINVAKTECGAFNADYEAGKPLCQRMVDQSLLTLLTDSEWAELKAAAYWAELNKYGRGNAKSLLGNILLEIMRRMGAVQGQIPADLTPERLDSFVLYSAHYPTLLGALSAINFSAFNPDVLSKRFPEYAAALIFELYFNEHDMKYFVRLLYKDGDTDQSGTYLALGETCGKDDYCPFETFSAILGKMGYGDDAGWCKACQNTETEICQLERFRGTPYESYIAASALGGFGFAVLIVLLALVIRRHTFARNMLMGQARGPTKPQGQLVQGEGVQLGRSSHQDCESALAAGVQEVV